MIRAASQDDADAVARIYNHYIVNSVATFEEQAVSAETFAGRMADIMSAGLPFLVAEQDGHVQGYAYASTWKARSAYRFTVETTVYLDPQLIGHGHGKQLYQALLGQLRSQGLRVALGCISLPNPASIALHEKLGFRKVAHFNKVGFKFHEWIDVGYWELAL